jgi:hypothetical protein
MPVSRSVKPNEADELRERATMMLAAFVRAEPTATWSQMNEIVARAKGVNALRAIVRELRGAAAGLSRAARAELERALRDRFGADKSWERDRQLVARVRARGQIRSEREYRVVQSYADAIAADDQAEFLALGALLDDYMAAPQLPNEEL